VTPTASGAILIVLTMLLWAGNAIVGRIAPDANVPPLALNFWRWTLALVVLAPFAIRPILRQRALFAQHWRHWVVFGFVTVAGFNTAYYIGLKHTTVVQGTLISASLPAFVVVASRVFLGQPITGRQIAGIVLSLAGVAIIVARGDPRVLASLQLNIGDLWMLVATLMWTAQAILIRLVPRGIDLIGFQVACFVPGLLLLAPFYLHETLSGQPMPVTQDAMALVGYAGIAASVIGFTCWNAGVLRVGAKTAGYLANLFPIFGAMLGILLLGEPFHWFHAAGAAATLAGIALATVGGGSAPGR